MNSILELSKDIYSIDIIEKVSEAFNEICDVQIIEKDDVFQCTFLNNVTDTELTIKEFENYLIGLSRKHEY